MKKESDNKKSSEDKIAYIPVCRECGAILTDENWYTSLKKEYSYICKDCKNKYNKEWQQDNKDKCNQSNRESNHRLRDEVINEYGGKCVCCGETRREYLTIDHINGGGGKHRREIGIRGSQFYRWLKQNNYPKGFQVLCFNCNCGKKDYGICPHNKQAFEEIFESRKSSRSAKSRWKLRLNIIEGYGSKCELYGESNPHFLTIDHIYINSPDIYHHLKFF